MIYLSFELTNESSPQVALGTFFEWNFVPEHHKGVGYLLGLNRVVFL